ncbi:MAG: type VI secretion system baseplate subunit TssG [Phycisphaerales bacterium]|nr:type VI secretion system baseplate subunit TssG [Phycisphaerales bacterium]
MAAPERSQVDALTKAVGRDPGHHGLFVMLREMERLCGESFLWGRTSTPEDEPVRVGQNLSLAFEGREIAGVRGGRRGQRPKVMQNVITLVGPAGPMPLHFAEMVREREFSDGDPVLPRFLDMLIHRIITLFYRAWATNRIAVSADQRPGADWVLEAMLAVAGMSVKQLEDLWSLDPRSIATRVAHMARPTRGGAQIREQLTHYFMVPVEVEEFTPCVTRISPDGRWSLTKQGLDSTLRLGAGVPLGRTTVGLSDRFRVIIGPVGHDDYVRFLPGERSRARLEEWIHLYAGTTQDWDLHLLMISEDATPLQLGQGSRLRRNSWLGRGRPDRYTKGYHRRFESITADGGS